MRRNVSRVMRKPAFCKCENKDADQLCGYAVTVKLISAFVFAIRIVQSLFYLNLKFQASSHLLLRYSLVCVGPGQNPRRPVFSQRGSSVMDHYSMILIKTLFFSFPFFHLYMILTLVVRDPYRSGFTMHVCVADHGSIRYRW